MTAVDLFDYSPGGRSDLTDPAARADRDRYGDRVDVLDKVKALQMLPDGLHLTTDHVATYYEVTIDAVKKLVQRNREELEANGFRLLSGPELRDMLSLSSMDPRTPHLAVFDRRALVRVGLLLRDSPVARRVRDAVQDGYETAAPVLALPQSYADALRALADQVEQNEAQARQIEQQAAEIADLDEEAAGYRHLLEKDGTVKWTNACDVLGVGPNLLGEYLRERKVTYTDVYFTGRGERREGERHNRPYADYKHWFRFAPYSESERNNRLPAWKQFDRRVTTKGVDGIRRLLRRHVFECGTCPLCGSLKKNRPDVFADYRRPPRGQHINYPKDAA
ncbi:phage antirepressor KilAC domain-containing protein [Saccharothrix variisporea]|uniref:Phage antirepressor YoqD-like protein n=1 Tax=Saccharothrix variisporea TaxID=543527 RepID=A0A495X1L1_9PSEU|nr:phage antirepressor KilAC domain-containing protein [Saccharothrix variisporea]RKT67084.1 phage antirepressor YoqD-like protein [Saccharothrix variisporea]